MSKAARQLGYAQPSLSQQIRKLEAELGAALFGRIGRGLALTEAGERLLPWAEQALEAIERGRSEVLKVTTRGAQTVTIGTVPSVDAFLLPKVLREFGKVHPEIEVNMLERRTSDDFGDMLRDGELDLAIARVPEPHGDLDAITIAREPIVLLLPPGHWLQGRRRVPLRMLQQEPFVSFNRDVGLRSKLIELCADAGFVPKITFETGQLDILREMVLAGRGFAVLPRITVGERVPFVLIDSPHAVHEKRIWWKRTPGLSAAAAQFLEFIEHFARNRQKGPADP